MVFVKNISRGERNKGGGVPSLSSKRRSTVDCGGRVLSRLRALNWIGVGVLKDGCEFDSVRIVHKTFDTRMILMLVIA